MNPKDEEGKIGYWQDFLDDRQKNEVRFARVYKEDFHHGTTGHNQLMLLATLAEILDSYAKHIGLV